MAFTQKQLILFLAHGHTAFWPAAGRNAGPAREENAPPLLFPAAEICTFLVAH